jgi:hypothetical protein
MRRVEPEREKLALSVSPEPLTRLYVCTSPKSVSVVENVPMMVFIGLFSSISEFVRAMSVGVALKSLLACGVGIQSLDQSATVSVSETQRRHIDLSIASIFHHEPVFSQAT